MYSAKDALRQAVLKIRNSLPEEILDKLSEDIQTRVISMNQFANATIVGAYHSIGSEVRTSKILGEVLQRGKRLALPRVIDETTIVFAEVKDLKDDLEVGRYDIITPKDHCKQLEKIDLALVPGIAWDVRGYRIGYGQGYYDRYLAKLQTTSIGLAYDFQVFEEIQHGKNDFCVDFVVTDKRVIRAK